MEKVYSIFEKEELFSSVKYEDLSTKELRELSMARVKRILDMGTQKNPELATAARRTIYGIDPATATRLGVCFSFFKLLFV